jgi:two-component system, sensor histidine kinase and response regulator
MHDTKSKPRVVQPVEIDREGVRQSIASAITILALFVVVLSASPRLRDHPKPVWSAGAVILFATVLRLVFGWRIIHGQTGRHDWPWRGLLAVTYAGALVWAVFYCAATVLYREDAALLPVFILTVLAASGEALALSFDTAAARSYIAVVSVPMVTWSLIRGRMIGYSFGVLIGAYAIQLWLQVKHRSSWYLSTSEVCANLSTKIAERRRSIGDLESAKKRAEEVSRAKSELLATMSHEIRTPLNDVILTAELLLATELAVEQRDFANTIRASGGALLNVVNEILDLSNIEAGTLTVGVTDLDVRSLVEQTIALVAEQAQRKGLELRSLIGEHVPASLTGDGLRLRQVLLSLLSDAVQFSRQGDVLLRVDAPEAYGATATLRFSIVDADGAVARELENRLTQLSTPSDSAMNPRAGLGPTICKRFVELMGGEIGFESSQDRGSTFWFTLPLRIGGRRAEDAPDLRRARILVVDDNATNRRVLGSQLEAIGVSVDSLDNGASALRALVRAVEQEKPYHAALVDDVMPQMDGARLARAVRSEPALDDLTLILLSSQTPVPAAEALHEDGFAQCLLKPVRPEQLRMCLLNALQNSRTLPSASEGPAEASEVHGRLLLVEDNAVNQKVAERVLEKLGYYVDTVGNGAEAVDKCQRGIYDAVLMDLQMPEMDGYSATREIRRREGPGRHSIIIAITASAMSGDREKCLAAGMDDYVTKPVRSAELQQTLQRHLKQTMQRSGGPSVIRVIGPASELTERLKELERDIGSTSMPELISEFLEETQRYVDRLREALRRSDSQTALETIVALADSSANMGARHLSELCSQLAHRKPLEDGDPMLSDLVEAHRTLTRDMEEIYPVFRYERGGGA